MGLGCFVDTRSSRPWQSRGQVCRQYPRQRTCQQRIAIAFHSGELLVQESFIPLLLLLANLLDVKILFFILLEASCAIAASDVSTGL